MSSITCPDCGAQVTSKQCMCGWQRKITTSAPRHCAFVDDLGACQALGRLSFSTHRGGAMYCQTHFHQLRSSLEKPPMPNVPLLDAWRIELKNRLRDIQPVRSEPSSPHALTPREKDVAKALLVAGSLKGAAKLLGVSEKTVSGHCERLREKMQAKSSPGAATNALLRGLLYDVPQKK